VLELADVAKALEEHLPATKAHLIEPNLKVLQRGYDVAVPQAT
jgi:Pyruvate/2-oxoacid:ferredoxin oxidoreductase gamma subunit